MTVNSIFGSNIYSNTNTTANPIQKDNSEEPIFNLPQEPGKSAMMISAENAKLLLGGTKDGVIDDVKQGGIRDCATIATVKGLSYTEKGAADIKDKIIEYSYNYALVHTVIGDYQVPYQKLDYVKYHRYSSGDDDMAILEVALEKAVDDIITGKVELSSDIPFELQYLLNHKRAAKKSSSLDNSYPNAILWLLTGKMGEFVEEHEAMNEKLDILHQNGGKDFIVTACSDFIRANEVTGSNVSSENMPQKKFYDYNSCQDIVLDDLHAYTVKDATDDLVIMINPFDTSNEFAISREDFCNNFYMECCDLSDDNPIIDYTYNPAEGGETARAIWQEKVSSNKIQESKPEGNNIYSEDGLLLETNNIEYDNNGNIVCSYKTVYNYDNGVKVSRIDDVEKQDTKSHSVYSYSDDNLIHSISEYYNKDNNTLTYSEERSYNSDGDCITLRNVYYSEIGCEKEIIQQSYDNNKMTEFYSQKNTISGYFQNSCLIKYGENSEKIYEEKRTLSDNGIKVEIDDNGDGTIDRVEYVEK